MAAIARLSPDRCAVVNTPRRCGQRMACMWFNQSGFGLVACSKNPARCKMHTTSSCAVLVHGGVHIVAIGPVHWVQWVVPAVLARAALHS
jgi:hypothetical protein